MARRKVDTSTWEDIFNDLTPEGRAKLNNSDTLTFMQDGKEKHYKVMKKSAKRLWIAPVRLYDPDEVDIVEKKDE